jgi:hypothetical protein
LLSLGLGFRKAARSVLSLLLSAGFFLALLVVQLVLGVLLLALLLAALLVKLQGVHQRRE